MRMLPTTFLRWVSLFCLLLGLPQEHAMASQPVVVGAKTEVILLDKVYFEVLEDPTGRLTLAQVQQPDIAAKFKQLLVEPYTMRRPGAVYWMRFRVRNENPARSRWFLELFDSHLAHVTWYQPHYAGRADSMVTGASQPYLTRYYQYRDFIFPLQLPPHSEQVYYVKLCSPTKTSLRSIVWNEQNLLIHLRNDSTWLGLFYGILGIIVLYNLCLFCFVRERTYLYYILYVLSCGLFFLSEDGLGFEYLWPSHPTLNLVISAYAPVLVLFQFALYSHRFLDTAQRLPRYNPWLKRLTLLSVVLILLDGLVLKSGGGYWLYVLPYAAYYTAALLLHQQGSKPARFYLAANLLVAFSVVFLIARKLGIEFLSDLPVTVYSMNIALVLEVFVLSYALGEKIQDIRNDALRTQQQLLKELEEKHRVQEQLVVQLRRHQELQDNLNTELERQVYVRTEELQHHALTIEVQNEELSEVVALLNQQAITIEELNLELRRDLQHTQEARVLSKAVSFEDFCRTYPDRDSCLRYLAELKWAVGFRCRKCSHEKCCDAREPYAQRCTRCGYVESATAYTPLHRCKFDIVKALYCIFVVHTHQGNYSSLALSQILQLRRATCHNFLQKIAAVIHARQQAPGYDNNESWTNVLLEDYQTVDPVEPRADWDELTGLQKSPSS
jgi:hypothetical protein